LVVKKHDAVVIRLLNSGHNHDHLFVRVAPSSEPSAVAAEDTLVDRLHLTFGIARVREGAAEMNFLELGPEVLARGVDSN